jgi:hypothetical protein
MATDTEWFAGRPVRALPSARLRRRRRSALLALMVLVVLIAGAVIAARNARACDAYILTGYVRHGDTQANYRSWTTGGGCEWMWPDWRAGATVFQNSHTKPTLLLGGAWLPFHRGAFSAGLAFGDALFGYKQTHQLAGGLALEWLGRDFGADAIQIPRMPGTKGSVLWLRAKVLGRWEPLK